MSKKIPDLLTTEAEQFADALATMIGRGDKFDGGTPEHEINDRPEYKSRLGEKCAEAAMQVFNNRNKRCANGGLNSKKIFDENGEQLFFDSQTGKVIRDKGDE